MVPTSRRHAHRGACGAESLLRWEQMPAGLTIPDIIAWAERRRLIRELDRHVRSRAFSQMSTHGLARLDRFSLAINVSALELREADFARHMLSDIARAGLPGWRICVEITESEWMRWDDMAISQLTELRASGIRIALDDFGAGYSSIAYLRQLPVDRIKLDRSLVAGMTSDGKAQRIVASIVSLGQTLGVEIVAEGVEDRATVDALLNAGCHLGQGFHFSPALPIARFLDWIR